MVKYQASDEDCDDESHWYNHCHLLAVVAQMMDAMLRDEVRDNLIQSLGADKVLWKKADLLPYVKDTLRTGPNEEYKHSPDLVVLPVTTGEVQAVVRLAAKHKIPLLPKGGGSNRTGMLMPIYGGIIVDTIKMNRVLEVNVRDLYVTVQPGITLKELDAQLSSFRVALNQEQGSFKVATVGGSISTAGFSRKHQKYGTISDRVMSLEIVLADGRVLRTGPKVLYTSTGYRLHQLFIGAEGTLGIITEATLRVEPIAEASDVVLGFYKDFWAANEGAQKTMSSCVSFVGGEAYEILNGSKWGAPPGMKGVFYVALEGTKGEVDAEREYVKGIIEETGGVLAKKEDALKLFGRYTEQWCGTRAKSPLDNCFTTYVPMGKLREYYERLWDEVMARHGLMPVPGVKLWLDVGRYRIAGGRYLIPPGQAGWDEYQKAPREIAELVTSLGGSISACHGVGLEHRDCLDFEYSEVALETMRAIKKALDPDNIMNPGKKLPPEASSR